MIEGFNNKGGSQMDKKSFIEQSFGQALDQALSFSIAMRAVRRERRYKRLVALDKAVASRQFPMGAKVILSNGMRGTVIRPRQTRFLIQGADGRKWTAHPGAMRLA